MTAILRPEWPASPIAWFQRLLQTNVPTSAGSIHDTERPTDLRYVSSSTSDRQGDAATTRAPSRDQSYLAALALHDLRRPAAQIATRGTGDDNPDYALFAMAAAADAQDEGAFAAACQLVDWGRSDAGTYEAALSLALKAGAHALARSLAAQGAASHPASAYLQQAARVLAPPAVVTRRPASNAGNGANKAWLAANRTTYYGQWVALRSGELLASAARLQDLFDRFGAQPEILYTRVT